MTTTQVSDKSPKEAKHAMTATSALAQWGGFSGRFERDAQWLALRDDIYGAEMLVAATRAFGILPLIKMPTTVSAVCTVLNLSERPAEVMLTCLAAMQVINRNGDTVALADSSGDVLRNHSRWFQDSFDQRPVYRSILESMRSNTPSGWAANERPWLQRMEDPSFAGKFIATMDARGRYCARSGQTNRPKIARESSGYCWGIRGLLLLRRGVAHAHPRRCSGANAG